MTNREPVPVTDTDDLAAQVGAEADLYSDDATEWRNLLHEAADRLEDQAAELATARAALTAEVVHLRNQRSTALWRVADRLESIIAGLADTTDRSEICICGHSPHAHSVLRRCTVCTCSSYELAGSPDPEPSP